MKQIKIFEAKIAIGFREEYTDVFHNIEEVYDVCQRYCDKVGLCVTVTPTRFIYKDGFEDGCFIGLINYPRFPSTEEIVKNHAQIIAEYLLKAFNQLKVSIICSDETYMIEREDVS